MMLVCNLVCTVRYWATRLLCGGGIHFAIHPGFQGQRGVPGLLRCTAQVDVDVEVQAVVAMACRAHRCTG